MLNELNFSQVINFCAKCWHVPCDCIKNKPALMIDSCHAPKLRLTNGMMIRATFKHHMDGTFIDLYLTDRNGAHVSARNIVYRTSKEKAAKVHDALNALKLEVISYEAGLIAMRTKNSIPDILAHISKRYVELSIEALA